MRDLLLSVMPRVYMFVDRQPRLTVVTLHRVGYSSKLQRHDVERHFRFLARHFQVMLPSELHRVTGHQRVAMVTIDDGHADAYKHVFPIARATGVPFSLCLPTDSFFRQEWLWFDKVSWAMREAVAAARAELDGVILRGGDPASFERLKLRLKQYMPGRRNALLEEMFTRLGLMPPSSPPEEYRSITTNEMTEMLHSRFVEVVAHTATHTIATVLPGSEFRHELASSKKELEDFCGQPIAAFCYPNGNRGDFSPGTAQAVKEAGFQMAFTSIEGTNPLTQVDPFTLKRVHAHRRQAVFEKLCSGLADLQLRLTGARNDG